MVYQRKKLVYQKKKMVYQKKKMVYLGIPMKNQTSMKRNIIKMKKQKQKQKVPEKYLNFEMYKELSEERGTALRKMARIIIKSIPKPLLIEILKKEKIIQRDWLQKGEVYIPTKKIIKSRTEDALRGQ